MSSTITEQTFYLQPDDGLHPDTLEKAINQGLGFLAQHQYPNGEFCCYIAADEPMQGWCVTDNTVFTTSVIASCLLAIPNTPTTESILTKATVFISYQMHNAAVWKFFSNTHRLQKVIPYDADSLAFASSFLQTRGNRIPEKANKPVLLANRSRKGLFYTWFILRPKLHFNKTLWRLGLTRLLTPISSLLFWPAYEASRNDIDLGVNASILYYLGEIPETKQVIEELIKVIHQNNENNCDKWYRNPFTIYYLISRAYDKGVKGLQPVATPIIERIIATASKDGQLGKSILDTALGIITLVNLEHNSKALQKSVDFIIKKQQPNGEWPRWLYYYGGPKLLMGWGSEELTTAFCLEAIAKYQSAFMNQTEAIKPQHKS